MRSRTRWTVLPGTTWLWLTCGVLCAAGSSNINIPHQNSNFQNHTTPNSLSNHKTRFGPAATLPAPTLSSPSNGVAAVATEPAFDWSSVSGANTYRIQVATSTSALSSSTSSDCSGCPLNETTSSSNYPTPSSKALQSGTKYYWQVRAGNSSNGDNGAWSSRYSFTTAYPPLPAPTLSAPSNGVAAVATEPAFDWSSVSGASTYRIQVAKSTSSLSSSSSSECSGCAINNTPSSSNYPTPSSEALEGGTKYYWQVRAGNSSNSQGGDWSSRYSFTTAYPTLSAPTLSAPSNGESAVATEPVFDWSSVSGASTYRIQVAKSTSSLSSSSSSECSGCAINNTSSSSNYPTPSSEALEGGTKYYWQVRAGNSSSSQGGDWSSRYSFTTAYPPLPAPVLIDPYNSETSVGLQPVFDWSDVTGADTYRLQVAISTSGMSIDQSGECSNCVINQKIDSATSTWTPSSALLEPNITYYWQVRAGNSSKSQGGEWSGRFQFSTGYPPLPPPTQVAPFDGQDVTLPPTFIWSDVAGADTYRIQVSESTSALSDDESSDCQGTCAINYKIEGSIEYYTPGLAELEPGRTYYWQVRAGNTSKGQGGEWSERFSFQTSYPDLGIPILVTPNDGEVAVAFEPVFVWESVEGATRYHLQLAAASEDLPSEPLGPCDGCILDEQTGDLELASALTLDPGTVYYWHVRAGSDETGQEGGWSDQWSFTTAEALSAAFTMSSDQGEAPLTVAFFDASTGGPTSWYWTFGDGGSSSSAEPEYTYLEPGLYSVTLQISNDLQSDVFTCTDCIRVNEPLPDAPVSSFSLDPSSGSSPLNVVFTDTSNGEITLWKWQFGDGETSSNPSPTHTYTSPGRYDVSLTVTGPGGSDTYDVDNAVTVESSVEAPLADFSASPLEGVAPLNVTFSDASQGQIESYQWRFGDGASSTEQSPLHVYQAPGRYSVSMTVTGPGGVDVRTVEDCIVALDHGETPAPGDDDSSVATGDDDSPIDAGDDDASGLGGDDDSSVEPGDDDASSDAGDDATPVEPGDDDESVDPGDDDATDGGTSGDDDDSSGGPNGDVGTGCGCTTSLNSSSGHGAPLLLVVALGRMSRWPRYRGSRKV